MNKDFDDELARRNERRSRRRPSRQTDYSAESWDDYTDGGNDPDEWGFTGNSSMYDGDGVDSYASGVAQINFPGGKGIPSGSAKGARQGSAGRSSASVSRSGYSGSRESRGRTSSAVQSGSRSRSSVEKGPGNSDLKSRSKRPSAALADNNVKRSRGSQAAGQTAAAKSPAASRAAAKAAQNRKRKRMMIMAVAECIALAFIFSYAFVIRTYSVTQKLEFKTKNVVNQQLTMTQKEHMKGYWTIAVFGVDSRGKNVGKGTNADVNMICNVNLDTGEIRLVSVFRDSYLNINDKNVYNKINAAYAEGGPEQAVKALNKNLDLNITDYITFNWKAVADGINLLGGVDIDISKAEFYYINSFITETVKSTNVASTHLKKAGMNHLDGVQAVAYGRLRLMDTDYARTERQRLIISKSFEKAKQADYAVLNNILVTVLPQVAHSLDFKDLTNMALGISKYHIGETAGFPFARGDLNMGKNRGDCVIPQTLEKNVIELHKFLFDKEDYAPTDTVKKISAKIAADSGMYKEGKSVDHVSTDGGYIPKATGASEKESVKERESSTEAEESTSEGETREGETTVSGRPGGDASGWEDWETDENGDPVDPAWGPGGSGTKPTSGTNPSGGSESSGAAKPTSATKPSQGGTDPAKPDATMSTGDQTGPGVEPTMPAETTTASPQPGPAESTTSPNPSESPSPSGGSNNANTNTPTVAPPPISPGGESSSGPGTNADLEAEGPGN